MVKYFFNLKLFILKSFVKIVGSICTWKSEAWAETLDFVTVVAFKKVCLEHLVF